MTKAKPRYDTEKARQSVAEAQRNLVGAYLRKVEQSSLTWDGGQRAYFLNGLETLMSGVKKVNSRNYVEGRSIREGLNLTQKQLATELGMSKQLISQYETRGLSPSTKGKGKRYLAWLAEAQKHN